MATNLFTSFQISDFWRIANSGCRRERLLALICRSQGLRFTNGDHSERMVIGSPTPNRHLDRLVGVMYGISRDLVIFIPCQPVLSASFTGLIVPGECDNETGVSYKLSPFAPDGLDVSMTFDSSCMDLHEHDDHQLTNSELLFLNEQYEDGYPLAGCIRAECSEDGHKPHRYHVNRFQWSDVCAWLKPYFFNPDAEV